MAANQNSQHVVVIPTINPGVEQRPLGVGVSAMCVLRYYPVSKTVVASTS